MGNLFPSLPNSHTKQEEISLDYDRHPHRLGFPINIARLEPS